MEERKREREQRLEIYMRNIIMIQSINLKYNKKKGGEGGDQKFKGRECI